MRSLVPLLMMAACVARTFRGFPPDRQIRAANSLRRHGLITFTLCLGLTLSMAGESQTTISYEQARAIVTEKQNAAEKPEDKEAALASLVNDSNQPVQVRIVAIESLGDFPSAASIATLIENISLRDRAAIVTKAAHALHKIGMSSMPAVLQALDATTPSADPGHDQRQMDLVQAMMHICGRDSDFVKWYYANEKTLRPATRNAILRYSIRF